jgi:hypothetical protein
MRSCAAQYVVRISTRCPEKGATKRLEVLARGKERGIAVHHGTAIGWQQPVTQYVPPGQAS